MPPFVTRVPWNQSNKSLPAWLFPLSTAILLAAAGPVALGADLVPLTAPNWDEFAPSGKEADAIIGDYVIRNDRIAAVIAAPVTGRNANTTIKNVAGSIIDFTSRPVPNDQLGVYYGFPIELFPRDGAEVTFFADGQPIKPNEKGLIRQNAVSWECKSMPRQALPGQSDLKPPAYSQIVRYTLADCANYLHVETTFRNESSAEITLDLRDSLRADRTFAFSFIPDLDLFLFADDWFQQAYGVVAPGYSIQKGDGKKKSSPNTLHFTPSDGKPIRLDAGKSFSFRRQLLVGRNSLDVRAEAASLKGMASQLQDLDLFIHDAQGPIENAHVQLFDAADNPLGSGRTLLDGHLLAQVVSGKYRARITANGRPAQQLPFEISQTKKLDVEMKAVGRVVAQITDQARQAIPCKVEFRNLDLPSNAPKAKWAEAHLAPHENTKERPVHPYFGPDSAAPNCMNLVYSPMGLFRQELGPGKYLVIISHGPEFDAVVREIEVTPGKDTPLNAVLVRSVDTEGWISADFHSHSSPSGDNTSDPLGRVLNLMAEHIEFAPCTEHNRITTYDSYIRKVDGGRFLKSCAGMELTGALLPINHQNAFPLVEKPHTQDGGGPKIDSDPEVQISRLALWDNNSAKLVQQNHPDLEQMLGDRDRDGKPDKAFASMFGWMDVVEIHNQHGKLLLPIPVASNKPTEQTSFHWAQLLNHGFRIPGVVNTDAHYNFHGSGWLRNWVKCSGEEPSKIDVREIVRNSEKGHVVVSNGPFLSVQLVGANAAAPPLAIPGDSFQATEGKCSLRIKVQCPDWFDINRVQVFLNARPDPALNFVRQAAPNHFTSEGAIRFEKTLPLELKVDTHIIVAALGEGLKLGPVMGPEHSEDQPIALSNPIFVDVEKDGFTSNRDDLGRKLIALPESLPATQSPK